MDARPPPGLRPAAWPPDRPDTDTAYEVVLAWGPFAVDLHVGSRIGYRLCEVRGPDGTYLTWEDGDRVHQLVDDDWHPVGDPPLSLMSPRGNGGTEMALIRPLAPGDYATDPDLADLDPEQASARLYRRTATAMGAPRPGGGP